MACRTNRFERWKSPWNKPVLLFSPLYSGSRLPHFDHVQGGGAGWRASWRAGPGQLAQLRDEAGEGRAVETVTSVLSFPPLCSPTLHNWPVGHRSLSLSPTVAKPLSISYLSPLGFSSERSQPTTDWCSLFFLRCSRTQCFSRLFGMWMYFSLLLPNLHSPNMETTIVLVGSTNEMMSDNFFASTAQSIKTRIPGTI